MNDGFIKLHRAILEWEWYDDPNTMRVFIHLLLNAQWEDSRYHGYEVPKGSLVIGRKKLAEELEITERAVRTALNHLKSTNEVTIKVTNQFSIVTIVNWAKYQGRDDENDQQNDQQNDQRVTNERPATDHIKEYKEIKNIRRKEDSNPCSIQEIFNSVCVYYKPCSVITKTRLEKMKILLDKFSLDEIKLVFEKANKSDFLLGKNDRGWKATFDWLIDIDNFVKVQEGCYDMSAGNLKKYGDYNNLDQLENETREKSRTSDKNQYHNYIHGNYDFEQLEKELRDK